MKLARYDYNALGKPVVKYTKSYGGSWAVSSYFIWDGDQLLLELDGSGNRIADYTYFPGTIDQPAAQSIGATTVTTTRDFRFDATGSVIGTVQGTGVSQKVAYSQWGGPDFSGNSDNHLMWKGLLYNEDVAGLIYMRGRWYDPAEGRFYNEDPIGHAGGENLYSFNDNDPINGSDPSGMTMALITVWGNISLYVPEPASDSWGAAAEASTLNAFFGGSAFVGAGGGGRAGSSSSAKHIAKPLGRCVESSLNLLITGVGDYLGATALRDAYLATKIGIDVGSRYLELRLLRGAGGLSKNAYKKYALPLGTSAVALFGGAAGQLMTFSQGLAQTGEVGILTGDLSPWDFVPGIASVRALTKAYDACIPSRRD